MGSVNGLTKERLEVLEAATVIGGYIDSNGHLILTTHDGTHIDAGAALSTVPISSSTQRGIVELATTAETSARTDATRAVTPAGLTGIYNDLNGRLSTTETAATSLDGRLDTIEATWPYVLTSRNLDPATYIEDTLMTSYPAGYSRIYLTQAQCVSGGWAFTQGNNEVITFYDPTNAYAKQTRCKISTSTGTPVTAYWIRTATATGWGSWRIIADDAVLPNPVASTYESTNTITATSAWTALPHDLYFSLVLDRDAIVDIYTSCWLSISAGASVRAGISIDSSGPQYNTGSMWGDVLYFGVPSGGSANSDQKSATLSMALSAGTHTIRLKAYTTAGATAGVNYPVLRATVVRWAEQ